MEAKVVDTYMKITGEVAFIQLSSTNDQKKYGLMSATAGFNNLDKLQLRQ